MVLPSHNEQRELVTSPTPVTSQGHNLPAHLPALIGRDAALSTVRRRLLETESGLLTLTGTGGTGKTRLALAVAASLQDSFDDGVWLVSLAPLADPIGVAGAVLGSIGVPERPGRSMRETLVEALRERSILLVLDNCEHLVEACAELSEELLRSCHGLRILATSREPLRVNGERIWRVHTLAAPDPTSVPALAELRTYPAVQLFVDRAQAVEPSFELNEHSSRTVAAICSRLDGLPLALELAAARVRVLDAGQILERLDHAFDVLVGGNRTAPPRQQTLRAALDWSFGLLDGSEQLLFERLAVFAGGFDLHGVESICNRDWALTGGLVTLLSGLVDKSMLLAESRDGSMRYRLLEPVRQYAHERLSARGEWDPTWRWHADYFLALAEAAEPAMQGPERKDWTTRLEVEHDNLRAVLRRCLDAAELETALRLGSALWLFWRQRGYRNEGERWLEEGLACAGPVSRAVRAKALQQVAELAHAQSEYGRATKRFEEALELRRKVADPAGVADTLLHFGRVLTRKARTSEEYQLATAMVHESLAVYRKLDQYWGAGWALQEIGALAWRQGALAKAAEALRDSVTALEKGGDRHLRAHSLETLGGVVCDMGDLDLARQLLDESLAEARTSDCAEGTALALCGLARVARRSDDLEQAASQCVESLVILNRLRLRDDLAASLDLLGGIACDKSQPERAARLLGAADGLREAIGTHVPPSRRGERERDLARTRAALGSARFATAWEAGRTMHPDKLVAYAGQAGQLLDAGATARERDPLSRREREVVTLLARGLTNRQIAKALVISERTADAHVGNILGKLGLKSRAQVAVWAVEHAVESTRK